MAEFVTVARPYAKAVFQYALDKGQLAEWSKLLSFAAVVVEDEEMAKVLSKPQLTADQKAELVCSVCSEVLTDEGRNFIVQLAQNDRLVLFPEISGLFELLKAEQEKSVDVTVSSAYELSEDDKNKLSSSLKNRLGRNVNISCDVDKSLLGGLLIRAGDLVIDGTVRGKLAKLSENLKS